MVESCSKVEVGVFGAKADLTRGVNSVDDFSTIRKQKGRL